MQKIRTKVIEARFRDSLFVFLFFPGAFVFLLMFLVETSEQPEYTTNLLALFLEPYAHK